MFDQIDAAVFHPTREAAYFFRNSEYIKYIPGEGVRPLGGSKVRRTGLDGWRSLPVEFRSDIDAAVCYSNNYIYFFKGTKYVKYQPGSGVVPTSNGNVIRTIGITGWKSFPQEFRSNIDAAFYYPSNGHAYFIKGRSYIKYNPGVGVVRHNGNPIRELGVTGWGGVPNSLGQGVHAALMYPPNDRLYFFGGRDYLRWEPGVGIEDRYPRRIGLQHRKHGGWPGLSTLLGTPIAGNVTNASIDVWFWLAGGKSLSDITFRVNGADVPIPEFVQPAVGTAASEIMEGVDRVDSGSMVRMARLTKLNSDTVHTIDICRADDKSIVETIVTKTSPIQTDGKTRVRFALGSCANSTTRASVRAYEGIAKAKPDLVVLCGDNCYYYDSAGDSTSRSSSHTPHDWGSVRRMLTRQLEARNHPQFVKVARIAPVFSTWDDHDFSYNNGDGFKDDGDERWVGRAKAAGVYRQMWNHPYRTDGNHIFYDFVWGPAHFFMTDGRYHSNRDKWILGTDQSVWLRDGLKASTAAVKVIVVSSQLIPKGSGEGFAAAASDERDDVLSTILQDVSGSVLVCSGDVHFSECQRYPEESNTPKVVEVTSSPLRVNKKKSPRGNDSNRLWHSVAESFALIDIVVRETGSGGPQGSITIEARDRDDNLLPSAGPNGDCRTVWDLSTRQLS